MQIASQVVALVMFLVGAIGCSDDMPLRATYEPARLDAAPALSVEPQTEVIEASPVATHGLAEENEEGEEEEVDGEATESEGESAPGPTGDVAQVDINEASLMELTQLPGVGPALAERIVEYRSKRPFKKVSDIQRVRGIGPAKFAKMKDQLVIR